MSVNSANNKWRIVELVQLAEGTLGSENLPPLQLLRYSGKRTVIPGEERSALWFVAGFNGAGKNDGQILQLLERAVARNIFQPQVDIYVTAVCAPFEKSDGVSSAEAQTLRRWANSINPKAIVSFSNGPTMIRHVGSSHEVFAKLAELAERELHAWGHEPKTEETPNNLENNVLFASLRDAALENDIRWVDFAIDSARKSFEDLIDQEWRPYVGPALKWLVEGPRFNPPKVEIPAAASHVVVPVLELPPEFANL